MIMLMCVIGIPDACLASSLLCCLLVACEGLACHAHGAQRIILGVGFAWTSPSVAFACDQVTLSIHRSNLAVKGLGLKTLQRFVAS